MDLKSFEKRIHNDGKGDAFSYDALKRLTNVTFDSPTPETPTATGTRSRAITLDKLDNILKITDNENAMVTEIIGELEGKGKALNQYSRFNDLPLEYDKSGNLSAKGSRLFSYDYRNRLIRSSRGDDAVTFTYDIFGRQTSRTDVSGTYHFFYAGDQKIEERNASGQVTKQYVWGNGIDELLRLDIYNGNSSTPYYVHTDSIGSTTTVTDENGNLVERVTYDVYGAPTFTDALGQTLKKSTIRNTTLFQGHEYDYDLALYNYRARYLDPSLGRFLQTDPLGYQDSMNLYQGMNMNPLNFVDPWGEYSLRFNTQICIVPGNSLIIAPPGIGTIGYGRVNFPQSVIKDNKGRLKLKQRDMKDIFSFVPNVYLAKNGKYKLDVDVTISINVYFREPKVLSLAWALQGWTYRDTLLHEFSHLMDLYAGVSKVLQVVDPIEFTSKEEAEQYMPVVMAKVKEGLLDSAGSSTDKRDIATKGQYDNALAELRHYSFKEMRESPNLVKEVFERARLIVFSRLTFIFIPDGQDRYK